MNDNLEGCLTVIFAFVFAVLMLIFGKVIGFALGYVGGWLLMKAFGDTVCSVLPIAESSIPAWCGVLSVVGGAFRPSNTTMAKKES